MSPANTMPEQFLAEWKHLQASCTTPGVHSGLFCSRGARIMRKYPHWHLGRQLRSPWEGLCLWPGRLLLRLCGGMSPKVPVLRIDCLEFHPNDVFLHVRKQVGPTWKVFVVPNTRLKQAVDKPIVGRHSFFKQAEEETGAPIPLIIP